MRDMRTLTCVGVAFIMVTCGAMPALAQRRPNVVLIYADDLGYGDVSSYGAKAFETPSIDRLAKEGLRFSDAHASAATCTPSRYAILTGEYAWRNPGTGILPGNAGLVIEPGRTTLPSVLRGAGYATGVVGKWHLGLGLAGGPDWNALISPGPNEVGLDASFIMAATGDRVPDSYNVMDAFLGRSKTGRGDLVEQAQALSLRQGQWKFIEPSTGPSMNANTNTELGNDRAPQLYNLRDDPGERRNVATAHPAKVRELQALLQRIRQAGRSRPIQP